jgi:hypothetical protein
MGLFGVKDDEAALARTIPQDLEIMDALGERSPRCDPSQQRNGGLQTSTRDLAEQRDGPSLLGLRGCRHPMRRHIRQVSIDPMDECRWPAVLDWPTVGTFVRS